MCTRGDHNASINTICGSIIGQDPGIIEEFKKKLSIA